MSIFTPHVNGDLKPEKRSGHVSFFFQGQFFVLGGYGDWDENEDDFLPVKYLWAYSVEASQWTRHTTKGNHPGNATGCCASVIGCKVFLFGGYYQRQGQTNYLFCLDLRTFTWHDLSDETRGRKPSPRDKFHSWKYRGRMIICGGFGHPPENINKVRGDFSFEDFPRGTSPGLGWNNHLYVLDCSDKLKWSQPVCRGNIPCPRAAFASCQIGSVGYLFGGRFKDERRNDLFKINLETFEWTELKTKDRSIVPPGRSWHVMTAVSKKHLFLYGGFDTNGGALKDTWIYDIEQNSWQELRNGSLHLGFFAPRLWHTASSTDCEGEVLIFGGCATSILGTESTVHTNTIAVFRFSPLPLRRQCLDYIMRNVSRYYSHLDELPNSLRRNISLRCHAIGLCSSGGHGKLVNSCDIM